MKKIAFGLALGTTLAAAPAHADDDLFRGPEVGVLVGAHFFSDEGELGLRDVGLGGGPTPGDGLLIGLRGGYAVNRYLTPELELGLIPTDETAYALRGHLLVHPLATKKLRPFVLAGFGTLGIGGDGDGVTALESDNDPNFHWGAGAKWEFNEHAAVRLEFRHLVVAAQGGTGKTSDAEVQAGFQWRFGKDAAPPPPPDTDLDGILDTQDVCVSQPEDKDLVQDEDGCPEDDADGDGVKDDQDRCPTEAGTKQGCVDRDPDGDGILDAKDACPNEAEDKDGFQDEDGCVDADNDQDGLPDDKDTCKDQPETKNGFDDADGCPDELPAAVKKFTSGPLDGVAFASGTAKLDAKKSAAALDELAAALVASGSVQVALDGHVSGSGKADKDAELSQQRADAVKEYLVGKGVAAERISTKGHGAEKPLVDDKSKEGREKNPRIELRVVVP